MGGYRVMPEAEKLIVSLWHSLKKEGRKHSGQIVLDAALAHIKANNRNDIFLPGIRKVQNILKDAGLRSTHLIPVEKIMQKPWSMATLGEQELPAESIPHVLQVWRYSVNLGAEFTIRQAKWVSRLYLQISDTAELWIMSHEYCREEELSLLTNARMSTARFDYFQVIGNWERSTILSTDGYNPEDSVGYVQPLLIPRSKDGGIAEELIHTLYFRPFDFDAELIEEEYMQKWELYRLIKELPSSSLYFPDFETRMVYLRQLSYLSKGPVWERLSPEEIVSIIVELRDWITNTKKHNDELKATIEKTGVRTIREISSMLGASPRHLYGRAGYPDFEGGTK